MRNARSTATVLLVLLLAACATVAPGQDKYVVRAEQTLAAADGDPSGYQTFTKNHTFISAPSGFKRTGGHPVVDADGNWVKREDPVEP